MMVVGEVVENYYLLHLGEKCFYCFQLIVMNFGNPTCPASKLFPLRIWMHYFSSSSFA